MMETDRDLLLGIVAESDGKWDTRNIDVTYDVRGGPMLQGTVLDRLRELEAEGLVESSEISGGTGPCWRLTEAGSSAAS